MGNTSRMYCVPCRCFRPFPPEWVGGREGDIECDFFFKLLKTRLPLILVYFFITLNGAGSLLCWAGGGGGCCCMVLLQL